MRSSERIIYKATNVNGYVAIAIGCLITMAIQSSSVTTSTLTPLVGVGVLRLEQVSSWASASFALYSLVLTRAVSFRAYNNTHRCTRSRLAPTLAQRLLSSWLHWYQRTLICSRLHSPIYSSTLPESSFGTPFHVSFHSGRFVRCFASKSNANSLLIR